MSERPISGYQDRNLRFAHMFYFELADTTPEALSLFKQKCRDYLSGYEGQIHFSIGERALQIRWPVSALNFEIAVNMIFENYTAYQKYRDHDRHQEFITQAAGMSNGRIVYDSFLEDDPAGEE